MPFSYTFLKEFSSLSFLPCQHPLTMGKTMFLPLQDKQAFTTIHRSFKGNEKEFFLLFVWGFRALYKGGGWDIPLTK